VSDWLAERQRRAAERWRRAEALGAFLPVDRTLTVNGQEIQIVATLADSTQTVVAFRAPERSLLWPSPVYPLGGGSGTMVGDLRAAFLPPVPENGSSIFIEFEHGTDGTDEIELPVDRARTRPYERHAGSPIGPVAAGGVQLQLLGVTAGLLVATADFDVVATDRQAVALSVGRRAFVPHPDGPGRGPLWREWHPPMPPATASLRAATATATATATARAGTHPSPPPRPPPEPFLVRAVPGGHPLAVEGFSGHPSPPGHRPLAESVTLRFEPPSPDAGAVELALAELYVFKPCDGEITDVPAPRPDRTVDLSGHRLPCGPDGTEADAIELLRWEPSEHGSAYLVAQAPSPECWPDIRIVAGHSSASLWLGPTAGIELAGGLPPLYEPLFDGERLRLGLRMLGRPAALPPVTVPLTRPYAP
jgi:hypothetical protein